MPAGFSNRLDTCKTLRRQISRDEEAETEKEAVDAELRFRGRLSYMISSGLNILLGEGVGRGTGNVWRF